MRMVACLVVALAACAPSAATLRAPVDADLAKRLGAPAADQRAIDSLLARPLDTDAAVRIALANSPRIQAALDELGIAGGGMAIALGPVDVDLHVRFGNGGSDAELTAVQDLLGLVEAARRRAAGRADVEAAQATATATALRLAARVEIAFHDLLAAQQELELRASAFDAADAAAALRERMHAAGNTSDLALARDRDAREQARVDVARAEADVEIRREELNALLGLSGDRTKWTASGRLADPPATAPALDGLEAAAVASSLDIEAARARATSAANRAADARLRAVIPHFGAGVAVEQHDGHTLVGPALRIGIPLLDWNTAERARTRGEQARAEHEVEAVAVELRASARAARLATLAAYQEARHVRDVILPLRQQIVSETLKHYNAMDADPFALIIARRELVDAGHQYLEALRKFANATTRTTALARGVTVEDPR